MSGRLQLTVLAAARQAMASRDHDVALILSMIIERMSLRRDGVPVPLIDVRVPGRLSDRFHGARPTADSRPVGRACAIASEQVRRVHEAGERNVRPVAEQQVRGTGGDGL